ncbi:MAG: MFS transporter, partial [Chitinophagales bacterium]|nr:MFS transporter [Chitinophagales bacterium]
MSALSTTKTIRLGLKENWPQFLLFFFINALVGGLVGLERTIIPKYAEETFSITANTALLSFIIAFGISKSVTNYFTGKLYMQLGGRNLLISGWLLAVPVPLLLLYALNWTYVIVANVLLGISQGITWSCTVMMKIDLVGARQKGLATGLNEFAGYVSVGFVAYLTAA